MNMASYPHFFFLITCVLALVSPIASARIVEHTFHVGNVKVHQLCQDRVITAVNGSLPGPTLEVNEGDTLIVHVLNKSPYNVTIHWHGIFQLLSGWADGPAYVTQCPIRPGNKYTYKFKITRQEGSLWWHAHFSSLRATVYGGLIIRPRVGRSYPFPKPHAEIPIILGEWWNANVMDVEKESLANGGAPNISDAFMINGRPGDLFPCSKKHTFKMNVIQGKTYLLRVINAAVNNQFFFKIANHKFTVVAIDASYTEPLVTDVIMLGPGQTTDILLTANQPIADYYMAAHTYSSAPAVQFVSIATTGIIHYFDGTGKNNSKPKTPRMPILPAFNDTPTAHKFSTSLTSLKTGRFFAPVDRDVDEKMFITIGLGISRCGLPNGANCTGSPFGPQVRFSSSMNNVSFELPSKLSMLEAFSRGVKGIYTEDFPNQPPLVFDYTSKNLSTSLWFTEKGTRVKKLKFNSRVEIVFQNTAIIGVENHPIHLHGFNFHVLGQGFGNYNPKRHRKSFNFVNPQERNTIGVPVGGWAVIRFRANNPGVWLMHCHLDVHLPWGLSSAFVVENGPTLSTRLPPPPVDLPHC